MVLPVPGGPCSSRSPCNAVVSKGRSARSRRFNAVPLRSRSFTEWSTTIESQSPAYAESGITRTTRAVSAISLSAYLVCMRAKILRTFTKCNPFLRRFSPGVPARRRSESSTDPRPSRPCGEGSDAPTLAPVVSRSHTILVVATGLYRHDRHFEPHAGFATPRCIASIALVLGQMIDQTSGRSATPRPTVEPDFTARKTRPLVGSVLRRARMHRQLSLREVERRIGRSNAYLSQVERGLIKQPDPIVLLELAELYGLNFRTLATWALWVSDDPDPADSHARDSTTVLVRQIMELNASERATVLRYVDSILRERRT